MKNLLIGSDPEIFVREKNTKKLSSIIGLLGGDKNNPIDIGKKCYMQEDNILAEFNIPATNSKDAFVKSIEYCKDYISTLISSQGLELHFSSSEMVNDDIVKNPNSLIFGCSPSYNVITEKISSIDFDFLEPEVKMMRSSGFHIHFGYDNPTEEINEKIVCAFELCVTLGMYDKDYDPYNRRMLYGSIGDCRFKEYGVECRSLGGYFLKNNDLISEVWDRSVEAFKLANSEISLEQLKLMVKYCIKDGIQEEKIKEVLTKLKSDSLIKI